MKKSLLITVALMVLSSCGSSDEKSEESATLDPYKIVVTFYDSLYKSSPYYDGYENSGSYLERIYFKNNDYNVSASDISEVIYTLPTMEGTSIYPDDDGSPWLESRLESRDGTITTTTAHPAHCQLNGELIKTDEIADECYAQMTAQGIANFIFSADYEFQIDIDVSAFFHTFDYYSSSSEERIIPVSLYFADYQASNQTVYLCVDVATAEVRESTNIEFVPEERVICQ
ncbi:hypothetical protein [Thalassotalea sp. ND16A]|uniref:hypothetical protein n=1 Tax=Thalassotalea sp. ND16A TaxID=1535422 RepID=UPI00051A20E9|nr:hypothetical protein [Thalassotalea sp. ND16A]KGJ99162.1 hypothetical protein ND16A_3926 [Thalassotalea sp. ND16A]